MRNCRVAQRHAYHLGTGHLPAFADLGRTVDEHDLLGQLLLLLPGCRVARFGTWLGPARAKGSAVRTWLAVLWFGWFWHSRVLHGTLELQTRFAGGVGQGLYLAMITGAAAVENHLFDALAQGRLRRQRAHHLGAGRIGRQLLALRRGFARRGGRGQGPPRRVINELHVDVLVRKANAHARAL